MSHTSSVQEDPEAGVDPDLRIMDRSSEERDTDHVIKSWNDRVLGEASVATNVLANEEHNINEESKSELDNSIKSSIISNTLCPLRSAFDVFRSAQIISIEDVSAWERVNLQKSKQRLTVAQIKEEITKERFAIHNYRLRKSNGCKFLSDDNVLLLLNCEQEMEEKVQRERQQRADEHRKEYEQTKTQHMLDRHFEQIESHIQDVQKQKEFSSRHYREIYAEAAEKRRSVFKLSSEKQISEEKDNRDFEPEYKLSLIHI